MRIDIRYLKTRAVMALLAALVAVSARFSVIGLWRH